MYLILLSDLKIGIKSMAQQRHLYKLQIKWYNNEIIFMSVPLSLQYIQMRKDI